MFILVNPKLGKIWSNTLTKKQKNEKDFIQIRGVYYCSRL